MNCKEYDLKMKCSVFRIDDQKACNKCPHEFILYELCFKNKSHWKSTRIALISGNEFPDDIVVNEIGYNEKGYLVNLKCNNEYPQFDYHKTTP